MGSKVIAKRNPLAGQPCLTLVATANCLLLVPCKFNLCRAVAVNHTQGPTDEFWQLRLPERVEDPGMVDTVMC